MDKTLQIIDANMNRVAEGLRVVEEITRFILLDEVLSRELKEIRHTLRRLTQQDFGILLLDSRDIDLDAGQSIEIKGEVPNGYLGLAQANLARIQEGLRALEEFSKLNNSKISSEFKRLRFRIYNLEKEIFKKLSIINRRSSIRGLYVIVDLGSLQVEYREFASVVIEGGAKLIQLRAKGIKDRELFEIGQVLRSITKEKEVLFIVNDRVDLALALDADGVHLGQEDLPCAAGRKMLGMGKIIGLSTHSLNEALEAERLGVDYIGFGPIYKTTTKPNLSPVGIGLLKEVKEKVKLPVIAIGGINEENIQEVIEAGADGVACASCLAKAKDVKKTAINLSRRFLTTN